VAIFTQLLEMWLAQLQQNVDGQEEEADPSSPSAADPAGVNSSNILGGLHGPKTRGQRMRQQAQQSTAPDTLQQHVPTGEGTSCIQPLLSVTGSVMHGPSAVLGHPQHCMPPPRP
jgi:hypothetical protein